MYKLKSLVPQSLKNLYHLLQAILANIIFGFPSRKMKVIGITGTDGKTTTVQMVTKILEEAGKKVAMASTINFKINGKEEKNLSHFTTASAFGVQKFIKKAAQEKCEYLVLETSSHSLDQYRVWGVQYNLALVTNVTREHLDYHKTIELYRKAKEKLFQIVAKNKGTIVVNLDMENPEDFLKYKGDKKFAYTTKKNQESRIKNQNENVKIINAEEVNLGIQNTKYKIQDTNFELYLPGMFNIENALAATCVGLSENIPLQTIVKAFKKIKSVPGRMEVVRNEKNINIIVDFALTPNALKKLYELLSSIKKDSQKIIAVFGSCGERDQGKRPIMGKIVSQYTDFIVLTNDEPYHEDPEKIINEIATGIKDKSENENFWKIADRREAIKKALQIAKPEDIIVVTGMGNFETMVVGDKKIPWNDRKVIEEELSK